MDGKTWVGIWVRDTFIWMFWIILVANTDFNIYLKLILIGGAYVLYTADVAREVFPMIYAKILGICDRIYNVIKKFLEEGE